MELEITRKNGSRHTVLIDDQDAELVAQYRWHVRDTRGGGLHARAKPSRRGPEIMMHSLLTGWPLVDHINRNGLDNKHCNLRPCTPAQNAQNRGPELVKLSPYKGVCQSREKWKARIRVDGRRIHLGTFATEEEAALAYDRAALEAWGSFAYLNFQPGSIR